MIVIKHLIGRIFYGDCRATSEFLEGALMVRTGSPRLIGKSQGEEVGERE